MKEKIARALETSLRDLMVAGTIPVFEIPEIVVTRPVEEAFGNYTSNVALMAAKRAEKSPHDLALLLQESLQVPDIERVEVAGAGYLNFFLSPAAFYSTLEHILNEGSRFGSSMVGNGKKVNNEFISANPTGPLHLGNGRGGFYADSLSKILLKAGYDVTNEYYVNDAGEQVIKLGHSVLRDDEAEYKGEYVDELHQKFGQSTSVEEAGKKAAAYVLEEMIQPTVEHTMRIHFDTFIFEERDIHTEGYIEKALDIFKQKDLSYEEDGALWLKTREFGDDKDRVLIKEDGRMTYFASDCGYILHKIERGFNFFIETWGADHHGYVRRFQAAAKALGFTGEVRFILVQLVKLVKNGEDVKMSKRAGNVVSIDELIERVGHDVARFFFLMYSPDTHMHFDLALAEEHSQKNPVYYVQYAHARLSSILRKAEEANLHADITQLSLLTHPKEQAIVRELIAFPDLVHDMAQSLSVHSLPQYAIRLSDRLHSFYADCHVVDEKERDLSSARLVLISAVKIVLGESLRLMGIAAPEKM